MLKKEKSLFKIVLDASMVGIQLVFATMIGFAIGYLLDTKVFKTFPWLTIVFFVLGLIAGFRDLIKMAIKSTKTENESDKKGQ